MLRREFLLNSQREIRLPSDFLADWRALRRRAVETAEFDGTIPHYIVLRWANKEGFIDALVETNAAEIISYIFNRACPTNPTHILGIGNSGISLAKAVQQNFPKSELIIARKFEQEPPQSEDCLLTRAFSYSRREDQWFRVPRLPEKSRVLMIDDVVSTGVTMEMLVKLMEKIGAQVLAKCALFKQGERYKEDLIYLAKLPIIKVE